MEDVISIASLYIDEYASDELYELVRNNLADQLDARLHSLSNPIQYLTTVRCCGEEELTLLMVAVLNGYNEIVQILFQHCPPELQVELHGSIRISKSDVVTRMTAVQCACYRSHFVVAKTLIDIGGADVNHDNDKWPNYPLLIQASGENRIDIVRFLVENGYADVNKTQSNDRDRCTAIILSAYKGYITIIEYLIEKGADINYSCKNSNLDGTVPITFAVLLGDVNVIRLLCDSGADTKATLNNGKTLVMVAVDHQHFDVVDFLLQRSIATIDDLELAANLSIYHLQKASKIITIAFEYRASNNIPKICVEPNIAYEFYRECQTLEEFEIIKNDPDRMWIEAALVRERILLPRNDYSLIRPLLDRGDVLASRDEFGKCFHLWVHAFRLYQTMQITTNMHRFVWLFCKMLTKNQSIPIDQFLTVCYLVFEPSQTRYMNNDIQNALFLVIITTKILERQVTENEERSLIFRWISKLCQRNLVAKNGETLLHFCVDICTNQYLNWRPNDIRSHLQFPNVPALQLLLAYGSHWLDLDAAERIFGCTALHLACQQFEEPVIVKCLIHAGAHLDCVNDEGQTPIECADDIAIRALFNTQNVPRRLKCICARLIVDERLNIVEDDLFTPYLQKFILMHDHQRTKSKC
ncbi:unnamed protein product [Rotaria magnacalcarata]|uniref:Uncharacterized protein n=3 Tax=Rotaria magnacalcarata TaxID=392030 RepID=A0A815SQV9_9BILA|nr:unnamed protein product [Rotaria magnacalcarata]